MRREQVEVRGGERQPERGAHERPSSSLGYTLTTLNFRREAHRDERREQVEVRVGHAEGGG